MNEQEGSLCQCGCGKAVRRGNQYLYGHRNDPNGSDSKSWKGGMSHTTPRDGKNGYRLIHNPLHARSGQNGYVREHILLAENALGRMLPRGVQVHHVNGIEHDNSRGNLVICENQMYHRLLHKRTEALYATGNAAEKKCGLCKQYGGADLSVIQVGKYEVVYHRSCHAKKVRLASKRLSQ